VTSKLTKRKKQIIKPTTGIDDPLNDPLEDCLDRSKFAERIFNLIDTTPLDTHLRIGIFGDWGSGKTTAMNFIKRHCSEKGHPVAVFHPWQFHSREDAWKGFVASLDKGLALWKNLPFGNFKRKKAIKNISGKARQLAAIVDPKIGRAFGELILAPLENLLEESKGNVTKDLKNILGDKRLYLFIDDLDRAEPEIVYDMLMMLNEIFDISQCVYIIGLDIKTVSEVLRNKLGYAHPKGFVDKVINWPFELPIPSLLDWESLLDRELNGVKSNIKKNSIASILDTLPKNPRKFKHYLRYLNSLHKGFLSHFGDDELDWKMLYLAQLLRFEFPDVFKGLTQDVEIINDIATGRLQDKQKDKVHMAFGADKKEDSPEWKTKIESKLNKYQDIDKDRFFDIYASLRECGGFTSPERVKNHLLVIEVPELMTWSEYHTLKNSLLTKDDASIKNELKKFIANSKKSKDIERVREFIKMLLRDREQIWSNLIDLHSQEEMEARITEVDKIMRVCDQLVDMDEIYAGKTPIFDRATFEEWFEFLSKWFHFKDHPYKTLRNSEKTLLLKIINNNLFRASEMSAWLRGKLRDRSFMDSDKAFSDIKKQINDILEKQLTDDLLNRFDRIDGIKELWPRDMFETEKIILFKSDSPYHSAKSYSKLQAIADKAKNNIEIQKNFVEFLRMLFYYSAEGCLGWVSNEDVIKLVQKQEFFKIIWQATTCRPLNKRLIGSLESHIKQFGFVVTDENYFNRPQWWLALTADKIEDTKAKEADKGNDK